MPYSLDGGTASYERGEQGASCLWDENFYSSLAHLEHELVDFVTRVKVESERDEGWG